MTNTESSDDSSTRLQILINKLNSNGLKFSKAIGVSQSFVSSMISGRSKISRSAIDKIGKAYPLVNIHWLLTGSGEMFMPEETAGKKESTAEANKIQEKYKINVPQNSLANEGELRKILAENLKTLANRWLMKKNELFGVLMPGIKKATVTNYFNGSSQPPLGALVRLEELTGIGLSAWVTREIQEGELPFEPLTGERHSKEVQLENVRESLRELLAKVGG